MIGEDDFQELEHDFYLAVSAEPDPGTLVRVLAYFRMLNVVRGSAAAEVCVEEMPRFRIATDGLTVRRVSLLAAKIGQLPTVAGVHSCRLWFRVNTALRR